MLRAQTVPLLSLVLACQSTPQPARQGTPDQLPAGVSASVLQHHNNATRDGVYVDAAFTRAAAGGLRQDLFFQATYQGPVDAQPLYWGGGEGGQALLLVFTERNEVIALDPISGRLIWSRLVDTPVPRSALPCGIIDPVGITGTPVIDVATDSAIGLVAMTTPNGGAGVRHKLYTLSIKDGSDVRPPIDIPASVAGFDSRVQNQRGALAAAGGRVFVPFAGHVGDCGDSRGWVIGLDPSGAQPPEAFQTGARGGGIWGMTGVAVADGFLFAVTGNTIGATPFAFGESIVRLGSGASFATTPQFDFYAPGNWAALDAADLDLGGSGAIVLDLPGASLVAALGKDGNAYLVDRRTLGGIGAPAVIRQVSNGPIVTAPSAINTTAGTFIAFTGSGLRCPTAAKGIVGLRINTSPVDASVAWCANMNGRGSTIVTTTTPGGSNGAESIVWAVGAEGDGQLHGVAADTGAVVFNGGNVAPVSRFSAPIVAKGRNWHVFQPQTRLALRLHRPLTAASWRGEGDAPCHRTLVRERDTCPASPALLSFGTPHGTPREEPRRK